MELRVVSHVNGDGDLLEAWFKYYRRLGVSSFHLVVHGPREENERLYALVAMVFAQARPVQEAPALLQTLVYAVLGLGWTLPLLPLIKWMERPDPGEA